MRFFHKYIEIYWFVTLLVLQVVVFVLFYDFLIQNSYLFAVISGLFLLLMFIKMRDIFVRPLQRIHDDIEAFRLGKISKIGIHGEHQLFGKMAQLFNAMMQVLSGVRDEYLAGKKLSDDVFHASELQRFMVGRKHEKVGGLEIIGNTRGAQDINGDSFDFFETGDQCYAYVGDATSHGVTSGLVGTMVNVLMEAYGHTLVDGSKIITEVNNRLYPRLHGGRIMTLALLRWDVQNEKMYLTGAGHEHVLVYNKVTKEIRDYRSGGIAIGMKSEIGSYISEKVIPFGVGDMFILYSDGITEARSVKSSSRDIYGMQRLMRVIRESSASNSVELFQSISRDFSDYLGYHPHQRDDVTLVCGGIDTEGGEVVESRTKYKPDHWTW